MEAKNGALGEKNERARLYEENNPGSDSAPEIAEAPAALPYTRYWSIGGRLRIKPAVVRECIAEAVGTFLLATFALSAGAQAILSQGRAGDVFSASVGTAVGVFVGIHCSLSVSGGHINPVISFLFFLRGQLVWWKLLLYIIFQHVGAFLACALIYALYHDAMAWANLDEVSPGLAGTAVLWASVPNHFISRGTALLTHMTAPGLLVFCVCLLADPHNLPAPGPAIPVLVSLVVLGLGSGFSLNVGAFGNPAIELSGRAFSAIISKSTAPFSVGGYHWFLVPALCPYVGALVATALYMLLIHIHLPTATQPAKSAADVTQKL